VYDLIYLVAEVLIVGGYHGGDYEASGLLGHNVVKLRERSRFLRYILPPSLGSKRKP
jgi:hypothetical protein